MIELRILSGSRAGQAPTFDQPSITVGRQPSSALRFDATKDIDVSGNHAELKQSNGAWTVTDLGSTNGTFVNGNRAERGLPVTLKSGDTITFGAQGPKVQVRLGAALQPTEQRIAVAVKSQTKGLRTMLVGAVTLLMILAIGVVTYQKKQSAHVAELMSMLDELQNASTQLQSQTNPQGDTVVAAAQKRLIDSLTLLIRNSKGKPAADIEAIRSTIQRETEQRQGLPQISAKNDAAVVFLLSKLGDQLFGGSGFCVSENGIIVTNRHNVMLEDGTRASSLEVKFANTSTPIPAHVIAVSSDADTAAGIDLAILKIDGRGPFPKVSGVSRSGEVATGASLATIGFPLAVDLPMERTMGATIMKTTIMPATASKKTTNTLQLGLTWAQPGSSGSPVFNSSGVVVGVLRGGKENTNGNVLFAVPSDKLAALLPAEAQSILR